MSVEALSAPMESVSGSIGPSMTASFSPRESLSSIMSMPVHEIGPIVNEGPGPVPTMAFDNRLTTTIWRTESIQPETILVPKVYELPFRSPEPQITEIAPIAREVFVEPPQIKRAQELRPAPATPVSESAEITIPDLTIKPLVEKPEPIKAAEAVAENVSSQPIPKPEIAPPMTVQPQYDVLAEAESVAAEFEKRQKAAEISAPLAVETETEPVLNTTNKIQTAENHGPIPQVQTPTVQEVEADAKLAQKLKVQIETNQNLSPERKTELLSSIDTIVETKTQTQGILQPQEVTRRAVRTRIQDEVEEVQREIRIVEPRWHTYRADVTEIVDEENKTVDIKTNLKFTGTKKTVELEAEAQDLAEKGVTKMVKIDGEYSEGEITTYLKNLQLYNQKAA